MKRIIYWIFSIILITSCIIYSCTYTTTSLDESAKDELELKYDLVFSNAEWRIQKYKQNNLLFWNRKVIYIARNCSEETIFPEGTQLVSLTLGEDEIFSITLPWVKSYDKVMVEESLDRHGIQGKVEVIYANRNEIDEENYRPMYRFTFTYNDLNFIIEFENGTRECSSYNIYNTEIKQDELDAYLEYICEILKI